MHMCTCLRCKLETRCHLCHIYSTCNHLGRKFEYELTLRVFVRSASNFTQLLLFIPAIHVFKHLKFYFFIRKIFIFSFDFSKIFENIFYFSKFRNEKFENFQKISFFKNTNIIPSCNPNLIAGG